jgi:hydroxymethylpyrimidine pyrophosphatase-like HAD family hydrolase
MTVATLVLATDLDGTFLGGSEHERQELYSQIQARGDVDLIFVTGREIGFIAALIETPGMPRPRYIIGDVGTSIYDGRSLEPLAELEASIAAQWNDAGPRITAMLDGTPGLRLQATRFRHRISYDCDLATFDPLSIAKVEAAGFDCLLSAGRFFDVLPKGISKGPTLSRLVDALQIAPQSVLVAGDTMNDLSLFETGFKGVAVGNSEPALRAAVREMPNVLCSERAGAAGISDAIRHFKFEGEPKS